MTVEGFAEKCRTDLYFTKQAIAAVLANSETEPVFNAAMYQASPETNTGDSGIQLSSTGSLYYQLPPIQQRLNISVKPAPGVQAVAPNQLTLVGYNGDWTGLLPKAGQYISLFPMGAIITALTQALFGTKVGPAILAVLLAL